MLKKVFFTMLMLLAIVSGASVSRAHDSDVNLDDNVLIIETDDSHDLVAIRVNPEDTDEIEVLILQFDNPFNISDFKTEQDLIDAADDFRDEHEDIDDVDMIEVYTLGGQDMIIIGSGLQIPCKLVGGDDDDFIVGSQVSDEIYGDGENVNGPESGNDTIQANAGVDTVHGGPGVDVINGGLDDDTLYGNAGVDTIRGWSGDDDIFGGADGDFLFGNSGEDNIYGDAGDDEMYGGSDDDKMWGGPGDDDLYGSTGGDDLYGESGNDELYGEAGRDALFGGNNDDYLDGSFDGEVDAMVGGSGADEFVNRYVEYRTITIMARRTVRQARWVWINGIPVLYWVNVQIRVPRTITYPRTLELEAVTDSNLVEGDVLTQVELN